MSTSFVHLNDCNNLCFNPEYNQAATTIQRNFRGFLARKSFLPNHLFPQIIKECKRASGPEVDSIPKATGGKTPVYLSLTMPEIVLKETGAAKGRARFHQMQWVKSILDIQKSSHLVVPKATLCKNFIVEERLPINPDAFHNMRLYSLFPEAFNEAVREITRLFSKANLPLLVKVSSHPLAYKEREIRYDNIPFFIVEKDGRKQGKIGLIDLERIEDKPSSRGLIDLARIFPIHIEIIKKEAESLQMRVKIGDGQTAFDALDEAANWGKRYLSKGFTKHFHWLQRNHLLSTCNKSIEISLQIIEKVQVVMEKELKRIASKHRGQFETTAVKISVVVINHINAQVGGHQARRLRQPPQHDHMHSETLYLRSLWIDLVPIYVEVARLLENDLNIRLAGDWMEDVHLMIKVVLRELYEDSKLFSYATRGLTKAWLRY
jgi:hypothetical protein